MICSALSDLSLARRCLNIGASKTRTATRSAANDSATQMADAHHGMTNAAHTQGSIRIKPSLATLSGLLRMILSVEAISSSPHSGALLRYFLDDVEQHARVERLDYPAGRASRFAFGFQFLAMLGR